MSHLHAPASDSPAAARAACAEAAAFAAELDGHRAYLLRTARMKIRDPAEVEDVVQEALIAAWNGRAAFRGQSSLRTWLVGILHHKIVDLIRERQRRPTVALDAIEARGDDEQGGEQHPYAQVTEGAAAAYERRALCLEVMAELEAYSPKAAQIFVLRELEGEDTGAICKRLRVTSANCYVLLHRARQFLHQRFAAEALAA